MNEVSSTRRVVRFGIFEVDLSSGELRKGGMKIKFREQPFQILALLLERPGEVVTREELQKKLWPSDTFVDFEHSLNAAIKKLREALSDSADNPRFVETLPKRGYRFIYPVEGVKVSSPSREVAVEAPAPRVRRTGQVHIWMAGLALLVLVAVLVGLNVGDWSERLLRGESTAPIRSLAVLPLDNLSDEPEHFTLGMTEALTTELGKISALRVISHTSAKKLKERLKETDASLPEIAQEFNLGAVVEGSVLRSEGRIRIDVQLIQANPELHLWAESYERDLRNVLALQSEIARAIAEEIKVAVTPEEELRLASTPPVNLESYQAYLKGRYLLFETLGRESKRKALPYFHQAIEKDPGFALAYWGLAEFYINLVAQIEMAPKEGYGKARAAVLKSLEIDPRLAESHATLGQIKYRFDWDWAGAEKEFKRAIELNPNSAIAHFRYGCFLTYMARWEESLAKRQRADELDPWVAGVNGRLWNHYWLSRQYDKAIELARSRLEVQPNDPFSHATLGWPYGQKGMHAEAVSEFERAVALAPGQLRLRANLGRIYADAGNIAQAGKMLRELEERGKRSYADPYHVASIYIGLREKDKAFEWLEKAYEDRNIYMTFLRVHPWLDPLRTDPRFQSLLRRMNFPP